MSRAASRDSFKNIIALSMLRQELRQCYVGRNEIRLPPSYGGAVWAYHLWDRRLLLGPAAGEEVAERPVTGASRRSGQGWPSYRFTWNQREGQSAIAPSVEIYELKYVNRPQHCNVSAMLYYQLNANKHRFLNL